MARWREDKPVRAGGPEPYRTWMNGRLSPSKTGTGMLYAPIKHVSLIAAFRLTTPPGTTSRTIRVEALNAGLRVGWQPPGQPTRPQCARQTSGTERGFRGFDLLELPCPPGNAG